MELQQDMIFQKKIIGVLDYVVFLCMVFCFWFLGYIYVFVFSFYLEDLYFLYGVIGIIFGSYGVM